MRYAARLPALAVMLGLSSACGTAPEPRVAATLEPAPVAPATPAAPLGFPVMDSDRDGVTDAYDACPALPGVRSPVIVLNGCPPPGYYDDGLGAHDRDGDGVLDDGDACPEDPGPAEARGCATPPDADGDGIADEADVCRTAAGPARNDPRVTGCPEAWVEGDRIRILEPVRFASGSADLLRESAAVLEAVATILAQRPDITKLRVEGHTDSRGGPVMNRQLSLKRASRVTRFLADRGILATRLVAEGIGPDRAVDTNGTEDGRATNRRVEFHVVTVAPSAQETPGGEATLTPAPSAPTVPSAPPPPPSGPPSASFDSSGL